MLLIFHTAGTHSHIGQQIGKIPIIVRIQHFIGSGQAGFRQYVGVEPANGNDTLEHVGLALRVWLVQKPLVARAGGAGLVGVHPGNQQKLVLHGILELRQPVAVIQHRVLPIG